MIENLNFTLKVIESDIFLSYFYYTVIFIFVSIFIKNKKKYELDNVFTKFLIHSGIFFIGIIIIKSILLLSIHNLSNRNEELNNMFGKCWSGYWFIPLIHFSTTQLFRLNKIKNNIFIRLILVLVLAFSWERYGAFLAYESLKQWESIDPEYQNNVFDQFTVFYISKHIALKIIIYGILAYIYYIAINLIKKVFSYNTKTN